MYFILVILILGLIIGGAFVTILLINDRRRDPQTKLLDEITAASQPQAGTWPPPPTERAIPGDSENIVREMTAPNEESEMSSDVQFVPIISGCGAGCLCTVIGFVMLTIITARRFAHLIPANTITLAAGVFMVTLLANLVTGYVTARQAKHARRLNVVIAAVILMLVSLSVIPGHQRSLLMGVFMLNWILTIPTMLVGSLIAESRDRKIR